MPICLYGRTAPAQWLKLILRGYIASIYLRYWQTRRFLIFVFLSLLQIQQSNFVLLAEGEKAWSEREPVLTSKLIFGALAGWQSRSAAQPAVPYASGHR